MDWDPVVETTAKTLYKRLGKRAMWVRNEVLMHRRKNGLCMRCGHEGHIAPNFSFLPPSRLKNDVNTVGLSGVKKRELLKIAKLEIIDEESE